jgi:serine/threonine-protein kinase
VRGGAALAPGAASRAAGPNPPQPAHAIEDPPSINTEELLDGKYRLVQQLQEGGMGSLYVAHNVALDVPVAVKIIRADLRGAEKRVMAERLLQEARAAAKLGHPAIVRMMDFGFAANGDPYLVMELLNGEDLATALDQRGRLSPTKAARIMLPIFSAMAAAHDQGIVHRDLKPENIYLSQSPTGQIQPKIIDFGIAKVPRRTARRLTMVGDALGTPDYMAPEQARGEDVDARADIWALATILYEVVSGSRPYEAETYHGLLRMIIESDPAPLASRGIEDEALCAIVDRGLRKSPAERWQSMRAMGSALAKWLAAQGISDDICGTSLTSAWLHDRNAGDDLLASVPPPAARNASPVVVLTESDAPLAAAKQSSEPSAAAGAKGDSKAKSAPKAPAGVESSKEPATTSPAPVPRPHARWPLVVLWLLALTGVAAAVTGFLDVPVPGIPTRLPEIWR